MREASGVVLLLTNTTHWWTIFQLLLMENLFNWPRGYIRLCLCVCESHLFGRLNFLLGARQLGVASSCFRVYHSRAVELKIKRDYIMNELAVCAIATTKIIQVCLGQSLSAIVADSVASVDR